MPLTEEQKQALQEKYKEQRQAMWEGKSASRRSNKDVSQVSEGDIRESKDGPLDDASLPEADLTGAPPQHHEVERSTDTASIDEQVAVNPDSVEAVSPAETESVPPQDEKGMDKNSDVLQDVESLEEALPRLRETIRQRLLEIEQNRGKARRTATDETGVSASSPPPTQETASIPSQPKPSPSATSEDGSHQVRQTSDNTSMSVPTPPSPRETTSTIHQPEPSPSVAPDNNRIEARRTATPAQRTTKESEQIVEPAPSHRADAGDKSASNVPPPPTRETTAVTHQPKQGPLEARQEPLESHSVMQSDSFQIRDRVEVQKEETGEEQFPTSSRRRRRRRKSGKKEREFWNPTDEEEKAPSMLTWKLALGVIGTVIVLIGLGILLGYWFAS